MAKVNEFGCSSRKRSIVQLGVGKKLDLGDDKSLCEQASYVFNYTGEGKLIWRLNGSTVSQPFEIDSVSNIYGELTDLNGCVSKDTLKVIGGNKPVISSFLFNSQVLIGDTIQFAQLSYPEVDTFYWDFGDGNTSYLERPQHTYFDSDTFEVQLIAGNGICFDTLTKEIIVEGEEARSQLTNDSVHSLFNEIHLVKIYPNPTDSKINVEVELLRSDKIFLSITNALGNILYERTNEGIEIKEEMSLETLSSGIYLLNVRLNTASKWYRIIKR